MLLSCLDSFSLLENISRIFLFCDECYLKITIHSTRITLVSRNHFPSVRRKFLCNATRWVFRGLSRPSSRFSISREFPVFLCSEATACNSRVMRCQTALRGVVYIETRQSFRKETPRRPTEEPSRISRPERDDDWSTLFVFA